MKKIILVALAAMGGIVPQLQAQEPLAEPVPMAYFTIPFAGSGKTTPAYGFQVSRFETDQGLMSREHPAYLDLQFTQDGLQGMRLNGTDMLDLYRTRYGYNANDSVQEWWDGLSDNMKAFVVVGSIAAAGCILDWCRGGGGDGDEREQGPPESDLRLKRDITPLVTLDSGLHLYSFRYLWSETTYVGVMAQDLLKSEEYRDAVVLNQAGFYSVRYDRLGLKMITLEEWNRSPQNIYLEPLALASNL